MGCYDSASYEAGYVKGFTDCMKEVTELVDTYLDEGKDAMFIEQFDELIANMKDED